jgi:hypothetical protein
MEASEVFNRAVEQPSAFERALSQRANSDQQSETCFALCSLPLVSLSDNDAEIPYRRLLLESIIRRPLTPEESLAIFHALILSSGMSSRSAQS